MPVVFLISHLVGADTQLQLVPIILSFLISLEMDADSVNIIMMNAFKMGEKFKF